MYTCMNMCTKVYVRWNTLLFLSPTYYTPESVLHDAVAMQAHVPGCSNLSLASDLQMTFHPTLRVACTQEQAPQKYDLSLDFLGE